MAEPQHQPVADTGERLPTPRLLGMMAGLWIWAGQFTVVYAFTALACARGFAEETVAEFNIVRLVIGVSTAVALVLDVAVLVAALRAGRSASRSRPETSGDRILRMMTATIAALSAIAIVYTGLPALLVPLC